MKRIVQLIPADGWRAAFTNPDTSKGPAILTEHVAAFALVEGENDDDGKFTQEVLPLVRNSVGSLQNAQANELYLGLLGRHDSASLFEAMNNARRARITEQQKGQTATSAAA